MLKHAWRLVLWVAAGLAAAAVGLWTVLWTEMAAELWPLLTLIGSVTAAFGMLTHRRKARRKVAVESAPGPARESPPRNAGTATSTTTKTPPWRDTQGLDVADAPESDFTLGTRDDEGWTLPKPRPAETTTSDRRPPPRDGAAFGIEPADPGAGNAVLTGSTPRPARKRFSLRFEGDTAGLAALRRGGEASLVFGDRDAANAALRFAGDRLDAVAAVEGARLTVAVSLPDGVELLSDSEVAVVRFVGGALDREARFRFRVLPSCADRATFRVEFFAHGARLYGVELTALVFARDATVAPILERYEPPTLDLDGMAASAQEVAEAAASPVLLLKASCAGDGLRLTLVASSGAGAVLDDMLEAHLPGLGRAELQALGDQVRGELGSDFFQADRWADADPGSAQWQTDAELRACCESAASAGSLLHQRLAATPESRALLDRIDAHPVGTRLTIAVTDVPLPFELMHPQRFSKNWPRALRQSSPAQPALFWGLRFGIEVVQAGEGDYRSLRRRHLRADREVSLNLDASLVAGPPDPRTVHADWAARLGARARCSITSDCETMKDTLLGDTRAAIVYVYCHGAPAVPGAGAAELLMLDLDCALRPTDLLPDRPFASAPIVILNACHAGAASPMLFTGFLQAFRRQRALGIVATTFYVPIAFGAAFGTAVIEACLDRTLPLGEQVRRLRARHAGRGNLAPLFYSVQCQLDPA